MVQTKQWSAATRQIPGMWDSELSLSHSELPAICPTLASSIHSDPTSSSTSIYFRRPFRTYLKLPVSLHTSCPTPPLTNIRDGPPYSQDAIINKQLTRFRAPTVEIALTVT